MKQSYKVLKKSIDKIGAKSVARDLGVSSALVYKWCQDPEGAIEYRTGSGAANPLDRLAAIYEATQDKELINWVCQLGDGYFVKNPSSKNTAAHGRVIVNIQRLIKEFSETLDVISKAYDDDRSISPRESKSIRSEWEDLKSIGEAFVRACESGKFHKR